MENNLETETVGSTGTFTPSTTSYPQTYIIENQTSGSYPLNDNNNEKSNNINILQTISITNI